MTYQDSERPEAAAAIPDGVHRLLDVGCWKGAFGAGLKRLRPDIEVWGIEPNAEVAEVAKTRLDRVVVGEFPPAEPLGTFDCVTFLDVLEHFQQPWDVLTDTRDLIAEGGSVVAAIPNVRHYTVVTDLLRRGRWTYRDDGILDRTHLRFFTRASMIELFQDSGYDIESIQPANMASSGRANRVLRMAGKRGDEFHAMHYVLLARPRG